MNILMFGVILLDRLDSYSFDVQRPLDIEKAKSNSLLAENVLYYDVVICLGVMINILINSSFLLLLPVADLALKIYQIHLTSDAGYTFDKIFSKDKGAIFALIIIIISQTLFKILQSEKKKEKHESFPVNEDARRKSPVNSGGSNNPSKRRKEKKEGNL